MYLRLLTRRDLQWVYTLGAARGRADGRQAVRDFAVYARCV